MQNQNRAQETNILKEDISATEASQFIIELSKEYGWDDIGILSADTTLDFKEKLSEYIEEKRHGPLDYMEDTLDVRFDVKKIMPEAKSVIILVQNYYTGDHLDHLSPEELNNKAKVSRYAWGADYHTVLKRRLRKVRKRLIEKYGAGFIIQPFSDSHPVWERAWALSAGLGFLGKSTFFIHRQLGTWTFLSGFLCNVDLAEVKKEEKLSYCGSCTRCIDACPTDAIIADFTLDANKCISTWTVEKPLIEEAEEKSSTGHGWLAGCDICQEVCPWNKFAKESNEHRFKPRDGHVAFNLDSIPENLAGSPLKRPKLEGLKISIKRALEKDES